VTLSPWQWDECRALARRREGEQEKIRNKNTAAKRRAAAKKRKAEERAKLEAEAIASGEFTMEEVDAATKIQSVQRGREARKGLNERSVHKRSSCCCCEFRK